MNGGILRIGSFQIIFQENGKKPQVFLKKYYFCATKYEVH